LLSLPGVRDKRIPKSSLQCLGLLWCQGDSKEKADELFLSLNPKDESLFKITHNDKDWNIIFPTLIEIASKTIIVFACK